MTQALDDFWAHDPFILPFAADQTYYLYTAARDQPIVHAYRSMDLESWSDEPVEVFGWCGGAVLLRPRYLADVGLLDERYFAYYEDFDMSWRGRLRGWRYRYVPDSVVHHRHAAGLGVGSERFRFLSATSEHERVAAFQAYHPFAGLGLLDDQRVDLRLL